MIKRRTFPEYNYNAVWFDLKTIRFGTGIAKGLPIDRAEFYDVGINTKCNANCDFCYVSASNAGTNFENICQTWEKWMSTFPPDTITSSGQMLTERPFQIAIGSTGEPTTHPQFADFLRTVYYTSVVPNYTTNGIILADESGTTIGVNERAQIIDYTRRYVGGVAISTSNPSLQQIWRKAANVIIETGVKLNLHHIISDKTSVDDFLAKYEEYPNVYYHVLLPLMQNGRSNKAMTQEAWDYLEQKIIDNKIENAAFGAHFMKYLENSSIKTWLYPPESLSKNVILEENCVKITPSSFDLTPVKIINL